MTQHVSLYTVERCIAGLAKRCRAFHDYVEDRLKVVRGPAYDIEYLTGRSLLFQGFV
jgi:hypothetical protein